MARLAACVATLGIVAAILFLRRTVDADGPVPPDLSPRWSLEDLRGLSHRDLCHVAAAVRREGGSVVRALAERLSREDDTARKADLVRCAEPFESEEIASWCLENLELDSIPPSNPVSGREHAAWYYLFLKTRIVALIHLRLRAPFTAPALGRIGDLLVQTAGTRDRAADLVRALAGESPRGEANARLLLERLATTK